MRKFLAAVCLPWCVYASAATVASPIYLVDDGESIVLSDVASTPRAVLVVGASVDTVDRFHRAHEAARDSFHGDERRVISLRVTAAAYRYAVPASLVEAVIAAESNYRVRAISARGALGLMQLMPATARAYGVTDPFDIDQNIDAGAHHLRSLITRFRGDTSLALAAYNAGAAAVASRGNRIPPFAETLAYVPRVLRRAAAHLASTEAGDPVTLASFELPAP